MIGEQQPETTSLPPEKESAFRTWVRAYKIRDLDVLNSHYDYRGAFLAGAKPDAKGHWPDTWKQHGHPTFSVESQYSTGPNDGGHWEGEKFVLQSVNTQNPTPSPNSYTLQDWLKILHNGSQVGPEHPQYAQVRQLMSEALARVAEMHIAQNEADSAAAAPNPLESFGMNAAQGMSMGLGTRAAAGAEQAAQWFGAPSSDPNEAANFLAQARSANPKASIAGDIAGGAVPSTILAAMGMPGAAAIGIPAGVQAGLETGSPTLGAGAGVGAAIGGKVLGKATKWLGVDKAVGGVVKAVAGKFGAGTKQKIGNMTVAEVRSALEKKGWDPQTIEKIVAQNVGKGEQTTVRTQSGGVTQEVAKAGEKMTPIAGTTKGFEVTGTRTTPPVPEAPTVAEIQDRLAKARSSSGQQPGLPQPAGGVALTPKGGAPADAIPEPFQASRQISGAIRQLEEKLGRPLTREEKDLVLEKILGAKSAKPGHPVWFGGGSPTPRGPE